MKISRKQATDLIKGSKGRVFGVQFIKRSTGEVRKMSARTGVSKYVTGEGLKFSPSKKNLIAVFDMNKQGYRMINLEGLTSLRLNGSTMEVEGKEGEGK
tara:strand:+ start:74 stop:370 length:297 start_codon:yes stop_codon:yes gene_type:complete